MLLDPIADRLGAAIAWLKLPELEVGNTQKPVRLAVTTGVKVGQDGCRKIARTQLLQVIGPGFKVRQFKHGGVAHHELAPRGT